MSSTVKEKSETCQLGAFSKISELEVLNVVPSNKAKWRLDRLTARARGRPRLSVRRVAAAAKAAAGENDIEEVGSDDNHVEQRKRNPMRRKRKRSRTPQQVRELSTKLQVLLSEKSRIELQRAQCKVELDTERHKNKQLVACRQSLEKKVATQALRLDEILREKAHLLQQVQELQRASLPNRARGGNACQLALVQQLAEMECQPLQGKILKDRVALKKKLLVKWHPDKQPSSEHVPFATRMMQEMQNLSEWK
jgi:hypothetical protein